MIGFNYKKAVQVINFFAIKEGGQINKMKCLKLIWLADRLHLRTYARPIINDNYWALKLGPIASNTKDLLEDSEFTSKEEASYRNDFFKIVDKYNIASISSIDEILFSKTDLEVMDNIYSLFGKISKFSLSDLSHKYPEWKKFEKALNSGTAARFQMSYLDFFQDPKENNDKVFDEREESLSLIKEMFLENLSIFNLSSFSFA